MIRAGAPLINMDGIDVQIDEIVRAIEHNLGEVASVVLSEAKRSSEFADKTGKLRRSLKKRKSKFEHGGFIVFSKAPHAHLVEFGHVQIPPGDLPGRRVPPHPFMRSALEQGIIKAIELFRSNR
jgi:hypothetical protein